MRSQNLIFCHLFSGMIFFITLSVTFGQKIATDLSKCLETQLVRDFYNPSEYLVVCSECIDEYVLSFDLQTCTHYTKLGNNNNLFFCKRLGRKGTCAEALCAIQLNEKNEYISKQFGYQDENCSQFNSSTGQCIYPRLQYAIDQESQLISKDTENFCAIKKNGYCIEYHSSFLSQKQFTLLLTNFFNSQEIDIQAYIYIGVIQCNLGFDLYFDESSQTKIYYGCVAQNYEISNCAIYDKTHILCTQCQEDYSLHINGLECSEIKNCLSHENQYSCLQCNSFSYLDKGKCIEIYNCGLIGQNSCLFCNSPFYGSQCQYENKDIQKNCELTNIYGFCTKCKNNEEYFFSLYSKKCELRQLSNRCKVKNYIADQCDTFECEDGYLFYINQLLSGPQFTMQQFSCTYTLHIAQYEYKIYFYDEQNEKEYHSIRNPTYYSYYSEYYFHHQFSTKPSCIKREYIENCVSYDPCFQSCNKCSEGYYLKRRKDSSSYYYDYICVQYSELTFIIPHCVKLQQDYYQIYCEICENYYTIQDYKCVLGTNQNCLVYFSNNQCRQCENNFKQVNYRCVNIQLCKGYDDYGNCNKCIQKPNSVFSLVQSQDSENTKCVQNQENDLCAQYINHQCMICTKSYVQISGRNICVKEQEVADFCMNSNEQLQCQQCITGYKLVNGKCFKVIGSCAKRYICDDFQCLIDCKGLSGTNNQTCDYQCPIGYSIINNSCYKCSDLFGEGCIQCDNFKFCNKCSDGLTFDFLYKKCVFKCPNGNTASQLTQCSNCKKNCSSCSSSDTCLVCFNNYYLQEGKCVKKCESGYQISNQNFYGFFNICFKCDENCEDCTPDACNKCKEGFYLENTKCVDQCTYFYNQDEHCQKNCYLQDEHTCTSTCNKQYVIQLSNTSQTYQLCTDQCNFFIQKEKDQDICVENCSIGYYTNNEQRLCQKCQSENCQLCQKSADSCNSCIYPYFENNSECIYKCTDGYLVKNISQCACNQFCKVCEGHFCTYCYEYVKDIFALIVMKDGQYSLEGYCSKECPKGFFESDIFNCKKCPDNCINCSSSDNCDICEDGYFPYQPDISITYTSCYYQCPDGRITIDISQCACCDNLCNKCTNPYECEVCQDGYYLNILGTCELNENSTCKIANCLTCNDKQHDTICDICIDGWIANDGVCFYKCPKSGELANDPEKCQSSYLCSDKDCEICDSNNANDCLQCKFTYFLFNGICTNSCPDGYYQTTDNQTIVCKKCNNLCKTCQSENECTSCKARNIFTKNCKCLEGEKFYKDKCLLKCPFYSSLSEQKVCIDYCVDGLHPYYTAEGDERKCEEVNGFSSNFCVQNIKNVPDILSFSLAKANKEDTEYKLKIRLEQTPSLCYDILFKGVNENSFPITLDSEDYEETIYSVFISKESISNNLILCSESQCQGQIEIYFDKEIQYAIFVTISFDFNIIVIRGMQYLGTYDKFNAVCPICQMPTSQLINSSIQVTCPSSQKCSGESIQTSTNSQIQIVQSITDQRYLKNKLYPHSVKLIYQNSNGEEESLYIKNYIYYNSLPGQIIYSFKLISIKSGKLFITSICNNADISSSVRILTSSFNNLVVYPQSIIPITVIDQQQNKPNSSEQEKNYEENDNTGNLTIIIVSTSVGGTIFLLIIGVVIYKLYRKSQNKNTSAYLRTQSNLTSTTDGTNQKKEEKNNQDQQMGTPTPLQNC